MKARLSVMLITALVMVTTTLLTPVAFAQEQQLNPDELQDNILQDANTLQDTLQGVQTGYRYSEGCLWFNGKRTCLSEEQIKETRDKCIATAVFTFGLSLLHEDCQKVFDYRITWG